MPALKHLDFESTSALALKDIEQWAFEAAFCSCRGNLNDATQILGLACVVDDMIWTHSRDWLSSFDMDCLLSVELRSGPVPKTEFGDSIGQVRKSAIKRAIEQCGQSWRAAMQLLNIDDRLANRLLDEGREHVTESTSLSARTLGQVIDQWDGDRKGKWIDVSFSPDGKRVASITPEAASLVVSAGVNFQAEGVAEISDEVAEILSGHKAGLSLGLNKLTSSSEDCFSHTPGMVLSKLAKISGPLFLDNPGLEPKSPANGEDGPIDSHADYLKTAAKAIEKLAAQGSTDCHLFSNVTAASLAPWFASSTDRISLVCLEEFITCSESQVDIFKQSCVRQLAVLSDWQPGQPILDAIASWGGTMISNIRDISRHTELDVDIPEQWSKLESVWLVNHELEMRPDQLADFCRVPGALFLGKLHSDKVLRRDGPYEKLKTDELDCLVNRKGPTIIYDHSAISEEHSRLLAKCPNVYQFDSAWN